MDAIGELQPALVGDAGQRVRKREGNALERVVVVVQDDHLPGPVVLVAVVVVLGLVYVKYNSDVGAKQEDLAAIQGQTRQVNVQIAALSPYAALQAQRTAMTETVIMVSSAGTPSQA